MVHAVRTLLRNYVKYCDRDEYEEDKSVAPGYNDRLKARVDKILTGTIRISEDDKLDLTEEILTDADFLTFTDLQLITLSNFISDVLFFRKVANRVNGNNKRSTLEMFGFLERLESIIERYKDDPFGKSSTKLVSSIRGYLKE